MLEICKINQKFFDNLEENFNKLAKSEGITESKERLQGIKVIEVKNDLISNTCISIIYEVNIFRPTIYKNCIIKSDCETFELIKNIYNEVSFIDIEKAGYIVRINRKIYGIVQEEHFYDRSSN